MNNDKIPTISVIDISELPSGETNISFEVDDDFIDYVKKEKNIESVDDKTLSTFVHDLLKKCSNGIDGYDYEKINKDIDEQ